MIRSRYYHVNRTWRPVRNIDTGDEYPSVTQAAKAIGVSPSGVYDQLSGRTRTVHGCRFEYLSPPLAAPRSGSGPSSRVPVLDTTDGIRYESVTAAARAMGVSISVLSKHLCGERGPVNGHTFERTDKNAEE